MRGRDVRTPPAAVPGSRTSAGLCRGPAHLRSRCARDDPHEKVYLSGEVTSHRRKNELETVLTELVPDITVCNDIHVANSTEPQSDREGLR